jgi:hypothetical protein
VVPLRIAEEVVAERKKKLNIKDE